MLPIPSPKVTCARQCLGHKGRCCKGSRKDRFGSAKHLDMVLVSIANVYRKYARVRRTHRTHSIPENPESQQCSDWEAPLAPISSMPYSHRSGFRENVKQVLTVSGHLQELTSSLVAILNQLAPKQQAQTLRLLLVPITVEISKDLFEAPTCLNEEIHPWIAEYLCQPDQPPTVPTAYFRLDPVGLSPPAGSNIRTVGVFLTGAGFSCSLPSGMSIGRSNIKQVAEKRRGDVERFLKSLFKMADEIAHSDLVYTFFHPLLRDQQEEINIYATKVRGKVNRCWVVCLLETNTSQIDCRLGTKSATIGTAICLGTTLAFEDRADLPGHSLTDFLGSGVGAGRLVPAVTWVLRADEMLYGDVSLAPGGSCTASEEQVGYAQLSVKPNSSLTARTLCSYGSVP
ncbi:hypothetical protein PR048_029888 [Dryococelus australis]|uniref:PX domain-containing protein n=1 Tax=Dryococelus australis TaxID=614101 RepID=A0ABQ9G7F8_9NEOP|nr:hypothetical protein PR048_029888 [Dryococelus australis]